MAKMDSTGSTSKDRALARFIEHKGKLEGTRPQDIPEVDEFPVVDISDVLRNYQGMAFESQDY